MSKWKVFLLFGKGPTTDYGSCAFDYCMKIFNSTSRYCVIMSPPIVGKYTESFLCIEVSETRCIINNQVREITNEKPYYSFIFLNSLFFCLFHFAFSIRNLLGD